MSNAELSTTRWTNNLRGYGFALVAYVLATICTNAYFMGDTVYYVDSMDDEFWEFGHLFWRPAGWLLSRAFGSLITLLTGAQEARDHATYTFLAIGWLSGLLSALLVNALVRRVCRREWVAGLVTVALIASYGFLNYAQTGNSYVPGLSLLLLGIYLLTRDGERPVPPVRTALLAGLALAGAVCLWLLYVWAIPAALAVPLFLYGFDRGRRNFVMQTLAALTLATGLAYVLVLAHLGIYTPGALKAWMAASSHGMTNMTGWSRTTFGLARTFIHMGEDGVLFKRFLVHDPFNPVTLADLFRLSLWKFALFYLFVAAMVLSLLRSPKGKRILALLLLNAIPLIAFAALVFEGGSMERYLPLYPIAFLALGYLLHSERSLAASKVIALLFVAAAIITNLSFMAKPVLDRHEEAVAARARPLQPLLKPESRVATVRDVLEKSNWEYPFNPATRNLRYHSIVSLNTASVTRWRQDFAAKAFSVWEQGGDMWVTRRVLSPHPLADWNWVEGDDPRVSWTDMYEFFSQFEMGAPVGGEDGFVPLLPTARNEQILSGLARENPTAEKTANHEKTF